MTGIPCSRAYSTSSSRPICQLRTGAITLSSGARVAIVASILTWSLPLPVQPWATVSQPVSRAALHRELRDQRPAERGEQRVAEAVDRVRLDRRKHVVARELLAGVHDAAVDRTELERLAADHVVILTGLAEVDGQRDHLGVVLVLDPLEHHARVEPAAVEQQDAVDVLGRGEVGGAQLWLGLGHGRQGYSAPAPRVRQPLT